MFELFLESNHWKSFLITSDSYHNGLEKFEKSLKLLEFSNKHFAILNLKNRIVEVFDTIHAPVVIDSKLSHLRTVYLPLFLVVCGNLLALYCVSQYHIAITDHFFRLNLI